MDYQGAWDLARRGLAIDTYDPASNYYYGAGVVAAGTDDRRASTASRWRPRHPAFRSAAWTELAKLHLGAATCAGRATYARACLERRPPNARGAGQIAALAARLRGDDRRCAEAALRATAASTRRATSRAFERYLRRARTTRAGAAFVGRRSATRCRTRRSSSWPPGITTSGAWTRRARCWSSRRRTAEVLYWLAFLQHAAAATAAAADTLKKAEAASPRLVFPFRSESAARVRVGDGAGRTTWRPKYYLALIHWSRNDDGPGARAAASSAAQRPTLRPFYAARAKAFEAVSPGRVAGRPASARRGLDPRAWRYGRLLVERLIEDKDYASGAGDRDALPPGRPGNYILGMLHAKSCCSTAGSPRPTSALARPERAALRGGDRGPRALPRGAADARGRRLESRAGASGASTRVAAAREWPEHLGAGKPYPEDVDERLEDWLEAQGLERQGQGPASRIVLERLAAGGSRPGAGRLLSAVALSRLGRMSDAARVLDAWAAATRDPAAVAWGRAVSPPSARRRSSPAPQPSSSG